MTENIVTLTSGCGNNIQAIVNADIPNTNIAAVLSNNETATRLAWTAERGVTTDSLNHRNSDSHLVFGQAMVEKVDACQPDLIVSAGSMRALTSEFCTHYENRLISIHPSIPPSFTGLHTHECVLEAGCRVAGCIIHLVTPELDCGPITSQGVMSILDGDTVDDVAACVLTVEHRLSPQAVADPVAGRLKIENNRTLNAQRSVADQSPLA